MSGGSGDPVVALFSAKTEAILAKYGPGPRVHFHTGLVDRPVPRDASAAALRRRLVAAQETLLEDSAHAWDADAPASRLGGTVLDVGCGLGGGALFWAQGYGARVDALTNVPQHVPWVERFATRAGVADRVRAVLGDAHQLAGPPRFDAAIAVESSCYLRRDAWFRALARCLRPGGTVHVVDCVATRTDAARLFDRFWRTRIGTLREYERAAARHGFDLLKLDSLTARAAGFWSLSAACERALRDGEPPHDPTREDRTRRIRKHERVRTMLLERDIECVRLLFGRSG